MAIGFGVKSSIRGSVSGAASLYLPAVNAEFNVWLLIVGLVVGAGLVWLVVMDSRRRESEIDAVERPREAAWLSAVLARTGSTSAPRPPTVCWSSIAPISRRRRPTA